MTGTDMARTADAGFARPSAAGLCRALGLAATPTFALMAWISATAAPAMVICSAASSSPIGDMAAMYLLMSLFHLPQWLSLASRRSAGTHPRETDNAT
jgi:hypothetical protein